MNSETSSTSWIKKIQKLYRTTFLLTCGRPLCAFGGRDYMDEQGSASSSAKGLFSKLVGGSTCSLASQPLFLRGGARGPRAPPRRKRGGPRAPPRRKRGWLARLDQHDAWEATHPNFAASFPCSLEPEHGNGDGRIFHPRSRTLVPGCMGTRLNSENSDNKSRRGGYCSCHGVPWLW